MEELKDKPGIIEASQRVLRELLRSPRFKASVKVALNSIDPDSTPQLVRTFLWEDVDIFLDLLGVVPDLINALILGLKELVLQLGNFPPGILAGFISQILENLDGRALGQLLDELTKTLSQLKSMEDSPIPEAFSSLKKQMGEGLERFSRDIYKPAIRSLLAVQDREV